MKKSAVISFVLFVLVMAIDLFHTFFYNEGYRKIMSFTAFFVFYPSFLISVFFSLNYLVLSFRFKIKDDILYRLMCLPILFFLFSFILRIIKVESAAI